MRCLSLTVIPGLPGAYVGPTRNLLEASAGSVSIWVAGTSPAMTAIDDRFDFLKCDVCIP